MRKLHQYLQFISCLLACLLISPPAFAQSLVKLMELSVQKSASLQLTLKFDRPVIYKIFPLSHPQRLVIDLENTRETVLQGLALDFSDTNISNFRHGIQNGYNLRLVFELKKPMAYHLEAVQGKQFALQISFNDEQHKTPLTAFSKTKILPEAQQKLDDPIEALVSDKTDNSELPPLLQVDDSAQKNSKHLIHKNDKPMTVSSDEASEKSLLPPPNLKVLSLLPPEKPLHEEVEEKKEKKIREVEAPQNKLLSSLTQHLWTAAKQKFIVVIDAGHGGHDPGAVGPQGSHEKNITLAIAKDLKTLVDQTPHMQAVLTRNNDKYISLRERLRIARKAKGDIFLAIHADAFDDITAEGASVYALSLHGSSSEAALWLSKKENYSELDGINLNAIENNDIQIRSVLIDLSQTAAIGSSLQLGRDVLFQLGKITQLHHNGVEQAPFMVLKSPDIPSVLVETGFITNPHEENRLITAVYQKNIAQALMEGINLYYEKNGQRNLSFSRND